MKRRFSMILFLSLILSSFLHSETYSDRTISAVIKINKNHAELVSYTVKNRPFKMKIKNDENMFYEFGKPITIKLTLSNNQGRKFDQEAYVGPLCLDHDPEEAPHILGDTIYLHEDSFVVELPEIEGLRALKISARFKQDGETRPKMLGEFTLDRAHFDTSIHGFSYEELKVFDPSDPSRAQSQKAATVLWPENFGETTKFKVFGNEAQSSQRINILIIPDGYTYAQKALMEQHAASMVQSFRNKSPYKEHDHLINYILVYAYSVASGTDQCDCGIKLDTAMGTGFQNSTPSCGHSDNRCLYYYNPCDAPAENNIVAAEQRAAYADTSVIMVNTSRYGGCGGARAVYSAGNSFATEVAIHEVGHTLGRLADEYSGNPVCGFSAGGINTSLNAFQGNWPEWIADIGAPRQGAQYYNQCIYRPQDNCEMRYLNSEFCKVCQQQFSLVFYGHPRVAPTAPLSLATPLQRIINLPPRGVVKFNLYANVSNAPGVINNITFLIKQPGSNVFQPMPVNDELWIMFVMPGTFQIMGVVETDMNFIKPQKTGANKDSVIWTVNISSSKDGESISPIDGLGFEILNPL